jgi:serine/threonine-protein kinase
MYISEKPHIKKVDLNGVISTLAGYGSNGNTGDGGDPLLATFGQAFTLAFDSNYILYICDAFNKNIRVLY